MQVAFCLGDIAHDLLFQSLGGGPAALLTQPAMKMKPQGSLFVQSNRVKVEQVRFHREGVRAKRWPIADVGHGIEPFPGDTQLGDVNAVWRQQLPVGRQVNGGNGERPADAASARGRGIDEETMPKQRARRANARPGKAIP